MNITWKQARYLEVGDLVYVRPLGGPDKVLEVHAEVVQGSNVPVTRIQVETYGYFGRLSHELVAVEASS